MVSKATAAIAVAWAGRDIFLAHYIYLADALIESNVHFETAIGG